MRQPLVCQPLTKWDFSPGPHSSARRGFTAKIVGQAFRLPLLGKTAATGAVALQENPEASIQYPEPALSGSFHAHCSVFVLQSPIFMGDSIGVKTTIEISNELFRKWKASAAAQGQSMKEFLTYALQEKLTGRKQRNGQTTGWRSVWGKAKNKQLREVDDRIQSEFERIDPESWR
jgi:hypothetical protein